MGDGKEQKLRETQRRTVMGIVERHRQMDAQLQTIMDDVMDSSVAEKQNINNDELSRLLQKINQNKNH